MTSRETATSLVRPRFSWKHRGKFFVGILLIAGTIALVVTLQSLSGPFAPGVQLNGLMLQGMSTNTAQQAVAAMAKDQLHVPVVLTNTLPNGTVKRWYTDAQHMGLGIDVNATIVSAEHAGSSLAVARAASLVQGTSPPPVSLIAQIDSPRLMHELRRAALTFNRTPVNAKVELMKGGGLGLKHEVAGRVVNISASAQAVQTAWQQYLASLAHTAPPAHAAPSAPPASTAGSAAPQPSAAPIVVPLVFEPAQPEITYAMLNKINGELGSFTTYYIVGLRGDNIHLATKHISGMVLLPGQVFSYNKTVGPRDASDGFKPAPVIIDGQLKPGMGGGVCQVSSTLYNAVLLSGLKVTLRTHHGFPVHYLSPGRDATVAYGAIDFQFENSSAYPIVLVGHARGGVMTFTIFGHKTPGESISLQRGYIKYGDVPVETVPTSSLPSGKKEVEQSGHPDIRALWYRVVSMNGRVISREPLYTHYHAFPTIVEVGKTAALPPAAGTAPAAPHPPDE